jgi:hypothetical protein
MNPLIRCTGLTMICHRADGLTKISSKRLVVKAVAAAKVAAEEAAEAEAAPRHLVRLQPLASHCLRA